jgi:putative endonuclease
MASYFVYVVSCKGGSLYTGITTDVARRLREHLSGKAPGARYTRVRPPRGLTAVWQTEGRVAASRLEWRIKHLSAGQKRSLVADPQTVAELQGLEADDLYTPLAPRELEVLWRQAADNRSS